MKKKRIILVRHGETRWSKEKRYLGVTDIPLNKKGVKQARAVSRVLIDEEINIIYTSVLKRAVETATIISRKCKTPLLKDPRLNESSFGDWEGFTFDEITNQDPDVWEKWRNEIANFHSPNGESIGELKKRVISFLQSLLNARKESKVKPASTTVIVSHFGPINIILLYALGAPLKSFWRLKQQLGSLSIIEYFNNSPLIVSINDTSHLR